MRVKKVTFKYKKPYGMRYDCYYNNAKIKRGGAELPDSGTLLLVEQNLFLFRLWWLVPIFIIALGFIGSYSEDWKDERKKQRTISVKYRDIISDELTFEVSSRGHTIVLHGVKEYTIDSITEEENLLIKKRIKIARGMSIAIPLIFLAAIVAVLLVCLL